jgi:geranylgeranyl diphosphate synthase, type I
MDHFDRRRERTTAFLDAYLRGKRGLFGRINAWGPDALEKLGPFVRTGKLVRSGLVAVGATIERDRIARGATQAGAAVELIQAALLIHDDIIDRDEMRRGRPSLHHEYALQGGKLGARGHVHFGEGMGICLADIAFFLAFELLSTLPAPRNVRAELVSLWSHELCLVGLAQMQDLYLGETGAPVRTDEIVRLYLYKTARYSFSVPLLTGAKLTGASRAVQERLDGIGESLGVLFQLKDDDLGLFGSEQELGKPVGSDIRECKQTLLSHLLFRRAKPGERKRLADVFGNPRITPAMVDEVKDMVERLGVRRDLTARMRRLRREAMARIDELPDGGSSRRILRDLVEFSLDRRK